MSTSITKSHGVREMLEQMQVLMARLRGHYVHGIKDPEDYQRATGLLDELTDGHELNKYEEQILIELEDAILDYEQHSPALSAFNAEVKATITPLQLLKDLMETQALSGSDLPEIGDKTAVSKVLSGDRPISHKMAFALAERFGMDPKAFAAAPVRLKQKASGLFVQGPQQKGAALVCKHGVFVPRSAGPFVICQVHEMVTRSNKPVMASRKKTKLTSVKT